MDNSSRIGANLVDYAVVFVLRGIGGLIDKVTHAPGGGAGQLSSWPGDQLAGFSSSILSVLGIVFGLGFVLSFGYWTTTFVEVQRAFATRSMSAARSTPITAF